MRILLGPRVLFSRFPNCEGKSHHARPIIISAVNSVMLYRSLEQIRGPVKPRNHGRNSRELIATRNLKTGQQIVVGSQPFFEAACFEQCIPSYQTALQHRELKRELN